MGKRSRFSKQAGFQEKPQATAADSPSPGKANRTIVWAALLAIVALGLTAAAVCYVVVNRNQATPPVVETAADPRRQEVEELIQRYFLTWSNQDIEGYGECFFSGASVQFIGAQGKITQLSLPAFLASQEEVFRGGQQETEAPESIDIRFEAQLARAVVYWKLTAGLRKTFGYDHFTLLKRDGKWGIVNLVFYETRL